MPDESTAATEHALLQEITAPLATLPDDPLPAVADVDFPIVLRGYDRLAVDAYVKRISQLVAELQATRSPEAAVRRGLERVGEEVAGILQRAHEAASQITAQSRSDAEDRLELARQEATRITADAERRLQDLDTETDRIWAERQRIVEDTQELARQLLSLSEAAADRFPAAEDQEGAQDPSLAAEPDSPSQERANGQVEDPSVLAEEPEAMAGEPEAMAGEPEDEPQPFDEALDDGESTQVMPPVQPPPEDGTA